MTREEQIDWLCRLRADLNNGVIFTPWNKEFTEALNEVLEQEPKTGWIPVKTRPMTEEETEHYSEYTDMRIDDTYTILDCQLPDDGQEVLVSWGGNVAVDIFIRDDTDGCYFEGVDIDEVDAWCPLPEPYEEG